MPEGGFVVKINGKVYERCFAVSFDFDSWQVMINNGDSRRLPGDFEKAEVIAEIKGGSFPAAYAEFMKEKKEKKEKEAKKKE